MRRRTEATRGAARERGLGVPAGERHAAGHVVGDVVVHRGRARRERLRRRQRLVLHLEQLARVLRRVAAVRHHRGHRLAHEAGAVARERGEVVAAQLGVRRHHRHRAPGRAEIGEGHHVDHARMRAGPGRVHARDARVRVRAAQEHRVEQAGQRDVGHVAPAPGEQPRVLLAEMPVADELHAGAARRARGRRRVERRLHDVLVAGAAAEVAGERLADLGLRRRRVVAQVRGQRHQDAGRAEAALQRVARAEGLLQRVQAGAVARPRPSTVSTRQPSAWTAKTRQERVGSPSTSTVHAPHAPCSQPRCVPVRPHSSRRRSARSRRGIDPRPPLGAVHDRADVVRGEPAAIGHAASARAAAVAERPRGEPRGDAAPVLGRRVQVGRARRSRRPPARPISREPRRRGRSPSRRRRRAPA